MLAASALLALGSVTALGTAPSEPTAMPPALGAMPPMLGAVPPATDAAPRPVRSSAPPIAAPPRASEPPPAAGGSFVRRAEEDDGRVSLQVASKTYRDPRGGPGVSLVGAVHIATGDYYALVQRHLDEHDAVLYESVTPRGAVRRPEAAMADPVASTRDSMLFLRRIMLAVREQERRDAPVQPATGGEVPAGAAGVEVPAPSIARTIEAAPGVDSRLGPWVRQASVDAWGGAIECEPGPDGSFLLISRGADRRPGGEGADADIRLRTPKERRVATDSLDDGLQATLAEALGLRFQLRAVDYRSERWEVADISEAELLRALEERGVDAKPFLQSLSGESLTGGLAKGLVLILRLADGLSGGSFREAARLLMIEALSMADERVLRQGLSNEMVEVILHERNHAAMDALAARRGRGDAVKSIAIFYGAAHMPDLERQLLEQGFVLDAERWFTALSADPKLAGVDAGTVDELRRALREAGAAGSGGGAAP